LIYVSPKLQIDPIILIMLLYNIIQEEENEEYEEGEERQIIELRNGYYIDGPMSSARLVIINNFIKYFKEGLIINTKKKIIENSTKPTQMPLYRIEQDLEQEQEQSHKTARYTATELVNPFARMPNEILKKINDFFILFKINDQGFYLQDDVITPITKDIIKKIDIYLTFDKERALCAIVEIEPDHDPTFYYKLFHVYKDDYDIVLAVVVKNGLELQLASDRLKDNEEIVLAAVVKNGLALQFASDRLKDNEEIVLAAIANNKLAHQYASPRLISDAYIITAAS